MLNKGTIVNVYEDPFTRIRLEGQARIVRHEADLAQGAVLYTVVFLNDRDHTPRLRKLVESVSTEPCVCYDQGGDNPDCTVHVVQLAH